MGLLIELVGTLKEKGKNCIRILYVYDQYVLYIVLDIHGYWISKYPSIQSEPYVKDSTKAMPANPQGYILDPKWTNFLKD
jgi:hypothetical protein